MFGPLLCAFGLVALPVKPQIEYRLKADPASFTGVSVELRMQNVPANLVLAAPAHPEYDDKYWRYLEGLEASDGAGHPIPITRTDSVLWRLSNPAGQVLVRYRVRFPAEPMPRAAWRAFLTNTGGLIGGPHSFLYPVGLERAGAALTVEVPAGWTIGTALTATGPNRYTAPDLHALMESPLQVGVQSEWRFTSGGIPHRIFYWRLPEARAFDTTGFVNGIQRIAGASVALFQGAPYRTYTFLFQDGAYGGLEHPASVTLGAPSATLAGNPNALWAETAHEFFHTWNLMHIKPAEYLGLTYRTQPPVAGLWFSEGLTLFYADLLLRRAGLPALHPTRIAHLESLMSRYWSGSGHARFSAEAISNVAYNAGPGALGDYSASVHLLGELIGAMLDLQIRDATRGSRSMDDVMRLMNQRFGGRGFTSADVRQSVEELCRCRAELFDQSIFAAGPIDFNRYLGVLGLEARVTWEPAVEPNGTPFKDLRLLGYPRPADSSFRLVIGDPRNAWAKAGLHTHDVLVSFNGRVVKSWPELRAALTALSMGDTVSMRVIQEGIEREVKVPVTGYDRPVVRIGPRTGFTPDQKRLFQAWSEAR